MRSRTPPGAAVCVTCRHGVKRTSLSEFIVSTYPPVLSYSFFTPITTKLSQIYLSPVMVFAQSAKPALYLHLPFLQARNIEAECLSLQSLAIFNDELDTRTFSAKSICSSFSLWTFYYGVGKLSSLEEDKASSSMVRYTSSSYLFITSVSKVLQSREPYFLLAEILIGIMLIDLFVHPMIKTSLLLMSLEISHHHPMLNEQDGGCQNGTCYSNPNLLHNIILGSYGPSLFIGYWVVKSINSIVGIWDSPIRPIFILVGIPLGPYSYYCWCILGLDLYLGGLESQIVLKTVAQRLKLRQSSIVSDSQVYNMTSLSDEHSRLRESPIVLPLITSVIIPGWFLTIQRSTFSLESLRPFRTALKWAFIGLLIAALARSTFEEYENIYFEYLDLIEDFLGVFHRWSMIFEELSFYFPFIIVSRLDFYCFSLWFEDAIKLNGAFCNRLF